MIIWTCAFNIYLNKFHFQQKNEDVMCYILLHSSFGWISSNFTYLFIVQQTPIWFQPKVVMFRFGKCGNATSIRDVCDVFDISKSFVQLFTNSSIVAIPSLYVGVVKWPSTLKHQLFKSKFHKIFSFLLVMALIDGTLIPLIFTPKRQGENYYTKKLNYAFLDMIIYDHKRKILHLMIRLPGSSCYDKHVFTNPKMRLTHEVYVFDDECFLKYFAYLL